MTDCMTAINNIEQLRAAMPEAHNLDIQTVDLNEPDGPVLFKDKAGSVVGWCSRECWDNVERLVKP